MKKTLAMFLLAFLLTGCAYKIVPADAVVAEVPAPNVEEPAPIEEEPAPIEEEAAPDAAPNEEETAPLEEPDTSKEELAKDAKKTLLLMLVQNYYEKIGDKTEGTTISTSLDGSTVTVNVVTDGAGEYTALAAFYTRDEFNETLQAVVLQNTKLLDYVRTYAEDFHLKTRMYMGDYHLATIYDGEVVYNIFETEK